VLGAGAGESGKSTILKQMKLIHSGGFTRHERKSWKNIIFHNLIDAFLIIFDIMETQTTELEDPNNGVRAVRVLPPCPAAADLPQNYLRLLTNERDIGPDDKLPPEYLPCFQDLWADAGVQLAMLKGNEYALHDNLN
jgi:guanine nucleotide-binding protein subunit alpha, other